MILTESEIGSLKAALNCWEWVGYISTAIVFLGCVGEFIAEFTSLPKSKEAESKWARLSLIVLILGIAGELLGAVRASQLTGQIIANIEERSSHADQKAGEANERASANEKEAAQLRKDAESERLARVKLEGAVASRRLNGKQKAKFTSFLKQYPDPVGIVVVSAALDSESSDFADDFNSAITDAQWKTLRLRDRLTSKTGISLGVFEGTPELDPWNRPILKLKKRIADALTAIEVPYNDVTFGKDDKNSTFTPFERGPIYLVIEHKPPVGGSRTKH